jgi:hypothetical protein
MRDDHGVPPDPLAPRPAGGEADALEAAAPEPPLAARLVVEIRTDGTRTVARGAVEDAILGERIAIKVEGATPLELALALAKAFFEVPFLRRVFDTGPSLLSSAARALLPGGKKPDR